MEVYTKQFLYDYQLEAVKHMKNGCILNGGVGSGKSRTALYYFFTKMYEDNKNNIHRDLYIITTARKRDTKEWEKELEPFDSFIRYKINIVIDSWNNIKKYSEVVNAFFIFDEQRVVGYGAWTKSFLKIARANNWILLSATPGDTWSDYIPVFIANGFYRNKTHFSREHIVYSRFSKYPKIEKYINTGHLLALRRNILVDMDFDRKTVQHHENIYADYDVQKYKDVIKSQWDPFNNEPIQQASGLCYVLRRIVNEDESRIAALLEILENTERAIIFYNFDYELDILKNISVGKDESVPIAEWNGHKHEEIPKTPRWIYLVQYTAGAEGWNCILTDTIIFYSQNYSYKITEQACGRIDRLNTPYKDLYYYHLKSRSGIDLAISKALEKKRNFNENKWLGI